MSKQEFMENLRLALNGRVSPGVVTENLNYYNDYINMEVRKGRTEEEVLASLGDPRLIARTIVQTHGGGNDPTSRVTADGGSYTGQGGNHSGQSFNRNASQSYDSYGQNNGSTGGHRFRIPGWLILILILVVVVLILGVVFSVLSFLLPVLLPLLVVVFLVKLFRDWVN